MVAGIALGVLVLVAFTAFVLNLAENAVRREAERRLRTTAELGARLVGEQTLRFEELVTVSSAQLRTIRPPVRARLSRRDARLTQQTLDRIVAGSDGVASAALVDPLGRLVAASPRTLVVPGRDLSGREWYRGVVRTHHAYVSRAYRSILRQGHPKTTTIAVPLRARGGRTIAIIAVSERARTQAITDDLGRELDAEITVTDQSGVVVARTGHASNQLLSRRADPGVAAALRGRTGVRRQGRGSMRAVVGYAPVRGSGWTVTATVPADVAFADVPRLRLALVGASGLVAFVLLWLVPLLVGRLTRAREALGVSEAFQTDLLPSVLPDGVRTHYVPGERRMLLGGDFLDAIRTADGSLAVCIGDVCGHGPRAAALGATLRAGWRTLASAGTPVEHLDLLDRLVESQRPDNDLFATVACAVVSPGGDQLRLALAGHPPPVLVVDGRPTTLGEVRGPALGLGAGSLAGTAWPVSEHVLTGDWSLALYTDGLIEARRGPRQPRLGVEGLLALVAEAAQGRGLDADGFLARVAALTGPRGSDDDVALLLVDGARVSPRPAAGLGASTAG